MSFSVFRDRNLDFAHEKLMTVRGMLNTTRQAIEERSRAEQPSTQVPLFFHQDADLGFIVLLGEVL